MNMQNLLDKKKKIEQAERSYRKLNQILSIKRENDAAELISSSRRRDFSLLSSEIKQRFSFEISYRNIRPLSIKGEDDVAEQMLSSGRRDFNLLSYKNRSLEKMGGRIGGPWRRRDGNGKEREGMGRDRWTACAVGGRILLPVAAVYSASQALAGQNRRRRFRLTRARRSEFVEKTKTKVEKMRERCEAWGCVSV